MSKMLSNTKKKLCSSVNGMVCNISHKVTEKNNIRVLRSYMKILDDANYFEI